MKRLTLEDIKISKPDFNASKLPKGQVVTAWLIKWTKHALECGLADFGDFIPLKEELADFLNVSPATIQNSIREVKNLGYFCSKQALGTYITDFYSQDLKPDNDLYKGTLTECKVKKVIIDLKVEVDSFIPGISEISKLTEISQNTIRFAVKNLARQGYFEKVNLKGNKHGWIYKKEFVLSKEELTNGLKDENLTLVHQLVEKIQNYLEKTYKTGEKILPNSAISNMFDVSIKTVNDAMKILNLRKIVVSRRGRYGTIFLGKNNSKTEFTTREKKSFQTQSGFVYSWQKALGHLKKHICENYEIGDKIPSIRKLAEILNVSPNTIRRALLDLFKSGHLISKRGKFGGIFIMEMPETEQEAYRWLALNPEVLS